MTRLQYNINDWSEWSLHCKQRHSSSSNPNLSVHSLILLAANSKIILYIEALDNKILFIILSLFDSATEFFFFPFLLYGGFLTKFNNPNHLLSSQAWLYDTTYRYAQLYHNLEMLMSMQTRSSSRNLIILTIGDITKSIRWHVILNIEKEDA